MVTTVGVRWHHGGGQRQSEAGIGSKAESDGSATNFAEWGVLCADVKPGRGDEDHGPMPEDAAEAAISRKKKRPQRHDPEAGDKLLGISPSSRTFGWSASKSTHPGGSRCLRSFDHHAVDS